MTIALYILLLILSFKFGQAYGDMTIFGTVVLFSLIAAPVMIKERKKGADD